MIYGFRRDRGDDLRRVLEVLAERHTPPPVQLTLDGDHRLYGHVRYAGRRVTSLRLHPGDATASVRTSDITAVLVLDEFP